eukprot:UN25758
MNSNITIINFNEQLHKQKISEIDNEIKVLPVSENDNLRLFLRDNFEQYCDKFKDDILEIDRSEETLEFQTKKYLQDALGIYEITEDEIDLFSTDTTRKESQNALKHTKDYNDQRRKNLTLVFHNKKSTFRIQNKYLKKLELLLMKIENLVSKAPGSVLEDLGYSTFTSSEDGNDQNKTNDDPISEKKETKKELDERFSAEEEVNFVVYQCNYCKSKGIHDYEGHWELDCWYYRQNEKAARLRQNNHYQNNSAYQHPSYTYQNLQAATLNNSFTPHPNIYIPPHPPQINANQTQPLQHTLSSQPVYNIPNNQPAPSVSSTSSVSSHNSRLSNNSTTTNSISSNHNHSHSDYPKGNFDGGGNPNKGNYHKNYHHSKRHHSYSNNHSKYHNNHRQPRNHRGNHHKSHFGPGRRNHNNVHNIHNNPKSCPGCKT